MPNKQNIFNRRRIRAAICLPVLFTANGCAGISDETQPLTPIRALAERPADFFERVVTVQGYLTHEFENTNIWEDARAENRRDCKRGIGSEPLMDVSRFNRKVVLITGTFLTWCPEHYTPDDGPDEMICLSTGSCGDTVIRFSQIREVN